MRDENVLSARRQYIMSRGQEFADTVRLFKSLGGGWGSHGT